MHLNRPAAHLVEGRCAVVGLFQHSMGMSIWHPVYELCTVVHLGCLSLESLKGKTIVLQHAVENREASRKTSPNKTAFNICIPPKPFPTQHTTVCTSPSIRLPASIIFTLYEVHSWIGQTVPSHRNFATSGWLYRRKPHCKLYYNAPLN